MEILRSEYLANDEYYHVYNRGVDHRTIVEDIHDSNRFVDSLELFNTIEPIQSIYLQNYEFKKLGLTVPQKTNETKLVEIICYCLNPNHFHLILKQAVEGGISEYMKRIGGYTKYFNDRHKRSGALFQGKYKVKHIDSNDYLLHSSAYVNINFRVHKIEGAALKLVRSSYNQYLGKISGFCSTGVILDQFSSVKEYKKFCEESLELMLQRKEEDKELRALMFE